MRAIAYVYALGLLVAGAAPAFGQTSVVNDSFSGSSASQVWQVYGGACLTAGSGAGSIPACASGTDGGLTGNAPDASGNGALRLTQAVGTAAGGIISASSFPSSGGFTATFTEYSYGGNGADGIAFILLDASKGMPSALGAGGGALGYAGITGGYVAVGIDEYGNWNASGCGGGGCSGGAASGNSGVAIRGSTANTETLLSTTTGSMSLWSNVSTRSAATSHTFTITMTAAGMMSVVKDGTTVLSGVNVYGQSGAVPANFRIAITASTGGLNNIHEITGISATSTSSSNLVTAKTSTVISDPVNGTTNPKAIPGARLRYCVQVTNPVGNPTATSIVVTDPISSLPVTFVAGSIYLGGTVTGGVCNWNGTSGGTYSAGTVSGTIASLAAGATATLYFDATVN